MNCWDWYCYDYDLHCVLSDFWEVGLAAGACGLGVPLGFADGVIPGIAALGLCSAAIATLADNGDHCCEEWSWYYYDC